MGAGRGSPTAPAQHVCAGPLPACGLSARKTTAISSSRLLAALLSSPSTVLVGCDVDGRIGTWSPGATALYGWTEAEALGQPLRTLLPADRLDELEVPRRLLAGEEVAPFETVRLAKDGTALSVELHVVLVRDDDGRPAGTLALHRDLRRERGAERALQVTQEELQARFARSPVPQSRVALTGEVLAVNVAMEALLGEPAAQLTGRDALTMYVPEDLDGLREALGRLAAGAESYVQQQRTLLRADGREIPVLVTVTVVHDDDGRPVLAGSVEDVTALRAAEERLRLEMGRFEALVQTTPVAVFTYDQDGVCTSSRGQALGHLGLDDGQLVGFSLLEMYAAEPRVVQALAKSLRGDGSTVRVEVAGRSWETHYRPLRDDAGVIVGGIGVALDLTERAVAEREVAANEARLRSLLQHATDVALVLDLEGRISFASAAARDQLGYDVPDLTGRSARDFNHPDDRRMISRAWAAVLEKPGATARFECRVLHGDGTWRWAEHVLTNLVHDPAVEGVVINVKETTERRRAEEELRQLAVRDALTGLANRTLLLDRAEQRLLAARRSGAATGIVVLDVVGMTALNAQLGQQGGDDVLETVAARLEGAVRLSDTVARVAGDEFAVLLSDVASEEELRAHASVLLEVMSEPVLVAGSPVDVRLRAGTSLSPAADAGALLAAAEGAAQLAGAATRVVLRSASSEVEGVAGSSGSADALRRAIRHGELVLHYQPVLRPADDQVVAAEALVRWQHPEHGLLLPAAFIPLAESSGLVVELGDWVLREACRQLAEWHAAGRALSVAVNLSPRQLVGSDFPDLVRDLLAGTGLPADDVVLEVTESAFMDDPGAPEVLRAVHELGVRLALDDFGTGYSSLTYLKRFPVDAIKIDRSFVSGLGRDADDEAIVSSVVSLARAVGKLVVAEGVETVAQLEALRGLGVDQAQGFLWSPAVPTSDFDAWLRRPRAPLSTRSAAPARTPAVTLASEGDRRRILALHGEGASLHTIAAALNAEGRRTPAGPRWTTKTVARVVAAALEPL